MKKIVSFIATFGIALTVLTISDYEVSDIRHWIPVIIVTILLIIRDAMEVK